MTQALKEERKEERKLEGYFKAEENLQEINVKSSVTQYHY